MNSREARGAKANWTQAAWRFNIAALLVVALFFRVWKIGTVPALNGDEAWFGIAAMRFWHGDAMTWHTPTHNLLNPLWCVPLFVLHRSLPPSIELLRALALFSGCIALPINWYLCRRTFDSATAWVSTILLAILPVDIAYSRLATDPAQSLAVTLPLVYLPLLALREPQRSLRWLALSLPFLAAAIWVHPTNGFCAFFLPVVALYRCKAHWKRRDVPVSSTASRPWLTAALGLALVVAASLLWTQLLAQNGIAPLLSPGHWLLFARDLGRLLSGVTIYRYFAGSCSAGLPAYHAGTGAMLPPTLPDSQWARDILGTDIGTMLCGFAMIAALLHRAKTRRDEPFSLEVALLLMTIAAIAPFYAGVGHVALVPGRERYALWLVAPVALIFARGLVVLREDWNSLLAQRAISIGAIFIAWSLLFGFQNAYFGWFARTGGTAAPTYRTAQQEPKLDAFRRVLAWRAQNTSNAKAPTWIIGSTWWNFQSLTYLAFEEPGVRVVPQRAGHAWMRAEATIEPKSYEAALSEGRVWFIGFAGSVESAQFIRELRARRLAWDETITRDNGGKPLMLILHVKQLKPVPT